jgi:hypothetical protein
MRLQHRHPAPDAAEPLPRPKENENGTAIGYSLDGESAAC